MSVTFDGTITKNNGTAPAAGTVAITPDGSGTTTVTLGADGSVASTPLTGTKFTVVETITGALVRTYTVNAIDGTTVDLSRDVGHDGASPLLLGANHVYINTGAPGSTTAPGAVDGDVYFRVDGTSAANTSIYHHEAASWVAAVTS